MQQSTRVKARTSEHVDEIVLDEGTADDMGEKCQLTLRSGSQQKSISMFVECDPSMMLHPLRYILIAQRVRTTQSNFPAEFCVDRERVIPQRRAHAQEHPIVAGVGKWPLDK